MKQLSLSCVKQKLKKAANILVFIVLFCFYSLPAMACGSFDLFCKANEAVESWLRDKSREAGGGAAEGFKEQMSPIIDQLFNDHLPKVIGQAQIALNQGIITAEEAANRVTNFAVMSLNSGFDRAVTRIEDFLSGSFRQDVLEATAAKAIELEKVFIADLDRLMTQNWYELSCAQASFFQNINELKGDVLNRMRELVTIDWFSRAPEPTACHRALSLQPKKLPDYEIGESFALWACLKESEISINMPARLIASRLGDIELKTANMICLHRNAPSARQLYVQKWLDVGQRVALWNRAAQ